MFLLVAAYPGCPGSKAVKRSLLLLLSQLKNEGQRSTGSKKRVETDERTDMTDRIIFPAKA